MKSIIGVGAKPVITNQYQIKTKGEDKMQEKQGYKIVDIKWDTDGDKALFDSLPQEIILPEQFCTENKDDYDYLNEVSEWLSDEYGFCHGGFTLSEEPEDLVETNIGSIPREDYLDIRAQQYGFDDYEDMKNQGYSLDA